MGGADAIALVVPYPRGIVIGGATYVYAALIADPDDLDSIAATVDFALTSVTPTAYVSSVLDLVEARAYWAGEIDWVLARQEILDSIDGLTTIELAQGALLEIIQVLRTVGDNHSSVRLAGQRSAVIGEASGFGFLVGGRQVLVVYLNGPADRAGVHVGDFIEEVNGRPFAPLSRAIDPASLANAIPADRWGVSVQVTLQRPGTPEMVTVTIAQAPYRLYLPPDGHRLAGDIGYVSYPISSPRDTKPPTPLRQSTNQTSSTTP